MNTEFEATFTGINPAAIRSALESSGATNTRPETLMRRVVFDPPVPSPGTWMRVRDEGDKITMSVKHTAGSNIEDQKESELIINSFEDGVQLLESVGCKRKSYQETKRESWRLGEVQIEIDTWPGLKPFVEIEADSEEAVRETAKALQLDYAAALFGAVDVVYTQELGISKDQVNNHTPEITFKNPPKKH